MSDSEITLDRCIATQEWLRAEIAALERKIDDDQIRLEAFREALAQLTGVRRSQRRGSRQARWPVVVPSEQPEIGDNLPEPPTAA